MVTKKQVKIKATKCQRETGCSGCAWIDGEPVCSPGIMCKNVNKTDYAPPVHKQ